MLSGLTRGQEVIAVAGTHGKTTTTAMAAWTLTKLGLNPSFVLGSELRDLNLNGHYGKGRYFVIEADEYDNMFLGLDPRFAIVTYMEHDHPDCFPTLEDYRTAFASFINRCQKGGIMLLNRDDPGAFSLLREVPAEVGVYSFGVHPESDYRISDAKTNSMGGYSFTVIRHKDGREAVSLCDLDLKVPGEHNMRNAAAVIGLVHQMGLDVSAGALALAEFSGAGRRFEVHGEVERYCDHR